LGETSKNGRLCPNHQVRVSYGIGQFFKASTAPDPVYHELRPAGLPGDLWGFFKQYGRQEEARLNPSIRTRKRFIANLRI
jgi:hypothetical protein